MKSKMILLVLFFGVTLLAQNKMESPILYSSEKGAITYKEHTLTTKFDIDYYYKRQGDSISIYMITDRKIYLGSEPESSAKSNFETVYKQYLKKYYDALKSKRALFDYNPHLLKFEYTNQRCYFYYYDCIMAKNFGYFMSGSGKYCVGFGNSSSEIKYKLFTFLMYKNKKFLMAKKIFNDENGNIKWSEDITAKVAKASYYKALQYNWDAEDGYAVRLEDK